MRTVEEVIQELENLTVSKDEQKILDELIEDLKQHVSNSKAAIQKAKRRTYQRIVGGDGRGRNAW